MQRVLRSSIAPGLCQQHFEAAPHNTARNKKDGDRKLGKKTDWKAGQEGRSEEKIFKKKIKKEW